MPSPLPYSATFCLLTVVLSACIPEAGNNLSATGGHARNNVADLTVFDAVDAIEIVESPTTGVALGWGWNRGDSEPVPTICVEFVPGEEPAQTRYMTMKEVNDSYELMKSLGVSAEASVKSIGFEASGKAAFAKSQNINSSKSTFVLNAVVQNGVRYAAPVPAKGDSKSNYQADVNARGGSRGAIRLTDDAVRLARHADAFKRHCGSAFVSAIYGGAKLTAAISFSSTDKKTKESLSAEMSGGGWGARFESKVNEAKTEGGKSERMDVSIFMTGGKGDAIPATKEDLLNKLKTISMDAYVAPKDFQIAISPYELLSNWPGKVLPDKETEFDQLASYWGAYNTLYDEFQQVLDNPFDYMAISPDIDGCWPNRCAAERASLRKAQENRLYLLARYNSGTSDMLGNESGQTKAALDAARKALSICNSKVEMSTPYLAYTFLTDQGVDIEALKRAQDEVLHSLKRMEAEARICSDKSDECDFDPDSYRSPYAFRIQLPLPVLSGVSSAADAVDYNVGRPAKSRCSMSSNDTACLSNAQIDSWGRKLGLTSLNNSVRPELFAKQQKIKARMAATVESNNDSTNRCETPRFDQEPGQPDILWFNKKAKLPLVKAIDVDLSLVPKR